MKAPEELTAEKLLSMNISEIAWVVQGYWLPAVHPWAVPYVRAMMTLDTVDDTYIVESGREIVLRFLDNSKTWRGNTARLVKAELRRRLAVKR